MAAADKADRNDPKSNKSLAIRTVLDRLPDASAATVAAEVQKNYGHSVAPTLVYLVKSKMKGGSGGASPSGNGKKPKRQKAAAASTPSPLQGSNYGSMIRLARQLTAAAGGYESASDVLKAVNE